MSSKDQKNMFCDKTDVIASGDAGDVLNYGVELDINQNSIQRFKCIYNEDVAGGTGAGHRVELLGAGSDQSYDTILATKTYADGSEPKAGDDFNLPIQEAEGIQYLKVVITNTTGDYTSGKITAFLTYL